MSARPESLQLRTWPPSGRWRVYLVKVRSLGLRPGCLLMTGYAPPGQPTRRTWGLLAAGNELVLVLNSTAAAETGPGSLTLRVGGRDLGTFAVSERPDPAGSAGTVVASVASAVVQQRILGELRGGSVLGVRNGIASLEEVLDDGSVRSFEECRQEIAQLS